MSEGSVRDLIHHRRPVGLRGDTSVKDACAVMRAECVGAVLVTDDKGALIGIFTGRDAIARVLAEGRDPATTRLREVMTPNPETVSGKISAVDALRCMQDGKFRHLPVVADGRVIGVISRGDFRLLDQGRLDIETGLWERL